MGADAAGAVRRKTISDDQVVLVAFSVCLLAWQEVMWRWNEWRRKQPGRFSG